MNLHHGVLPLKDAGCERFGLDNQHRLVGHSFPTNVVLLLPQVPARTAREDLRPSHVQTSGRNNGKARGSLDDRWCYTHPKPAASRTSFSSTPSFWTRLIRWLSRGVRRGSLNDRWCYTHPKPRASRTLFSVAPSVRTLLSWRIGRGVSRGSLNDRWCYTHPEPMASRLT